MSLLDTDLYKVDDWSYKCSYSVTDEILHQLTMQQAVLEHFPEKVVKYKFKNRSQGMYFTPACVKWFRESIQSRFLDISACSPWHQRPYLRRSIH